MPSKGKEKKGSGAAKVVTQKSRARQLAHKSQPLPTYSPTPGEDKSELNRTVSYPVETEASLNIVMGMLVDIKSPVDWRPLNILWMKLEQTRLWKHVHRNKRSIIMYVANN